MGTPRPRSMTALALAAFLVIALMLIAGMLGGCARNVPTKTIAFQGDSNPPKTGIIATVDIISAPGHNTTIKYPQEYPTRAPFIHFHSGPVGSIASYSLKVFPIEPGQTVTCVISINGLIVDRGSAKYPKPAVCSGPPI